ncbi:saccharopine dehydrogenase [Octadecabacter sp. 1_MG-2023]|uniref:saccharopine dehydrogenase n=1 Tax=unclassified Octadecabacter TaxID=196158 RepID=UPI001C08E816|nr:MULTISPECIES: saccharopine dehydrogenase [unclassified Octadecabacter]MBU2992097.1 saccharopine dehydrogenase [Octadecabacter sp. B2R22]MDO6735146.1 saccharopine dehydrogenase [Octadecabacter sp. 1_MG-2023]
MLIWMRHESRANEARAPLTPDGAKQMIAKGWRVVVETAPHRCIPDSAYFDVGCEAAAAGSWVDAPSDAIILGLKELPEDGAPLRHRHIMFGHAYKGQASGRVLLDRFKANGGTLLDLEYLVDGTGRRVAAFGYWAGYAGAALSVMALGAQHRGEVMASVDAFTSATALAETAKSSVTGTPNALIIGALGRVGTGASDLCRAAGITPTGWDMAETAHGGPFPEILGFDILLNCILAHDGAPVFVQADAGQTPRKLSVIGDIACDPESEFSPIKVYDRATSWAVPTVRAHQDPPLDVMAIDNLPSLLPVESTDDFAHQLLPHLLELETDSTGVWSRAEATYKQHV